MATVKKDAKNTKKKASKKEVKKTASKKKETALVDSNVSVTKETEKKEKKVVGKKVADKKTVESKKEKKPGLFKRIKTFFKEVKKEVSYVKWPSKKDMVKYSIATIGFVLFFSLFFYIIDLIVAAVKTWV